MVKRFSENHLNDLFGTTASLKEGRVPKDKVSFTRSMVDHMFLALDVDGDGFISKVMCFSFTNFVAMCRVL